MQFTDSLPMPPSDALEHCNLLIHRIKAEIEKSENGISFRRFMEMALYEPAFGYYVAGMRKIGTEGDFITAPEISSLFSQCLANQCQEVLQNVEGGDILELGAGSGIMAADILQQLESVNSLPETYYILDISPELKQRQRETLQKHVPHLLNKVTWLDQLPSDDFIGVILGNEVLDAMPVDVFVLEGGSIKEQRVVWQNDYFAYINTDAPEHIDKPIQHLKIDAKDYTSEINNNLSGWFQSLARFFKQGVMLLIDYGYVRQEYYLPERTMGTLLCHYQHRSHDQPLIYPGLQDITASVDFTAVAEAASDANFDVIGFTNQANFLASSGIETLFIKELERNPEQQYKLAQQIRTLSLPGEMGERFKVIAIGKEFTHTLSGFALGDQRHRL